MKISQIIADIKRKQKPIFSFEFFPPKTEEASEHLYNTVKELQKLNPAFISITYGAGGSTRQKTRELSTTIQNKIQLETMAHLTCVGSSRAEILDILQQYKKDNIHNILALRGDPPKGESTFIPALDGFHHANELVAFIKDNFGDCFDIGVAGYPEKHLEAVDYSTDLHNLQKKIEAGASFIITQLFLDNSTFYYFRDEAQKIGIQVPILAGIMPVTNFNQIKRFTEMNGASIPATLLQKLENAEKQTNADSIDAEIKKIGIEWATSQCQDLLKEGVEGIHFYTLNRSLPTLEIFRSFI